MTEITKNLSLELVAGEGFDPPRLGATWSPSTLEILRMGNISSLMPTAGTRERDHCDMAEVHVKLTETVGQEEDFATLFVSSTPIILYQFIIF